MKRAIFFLLFAVNSVFALETPFNHGVNITEWFQSPSVGQIQFTKYTKQDLINIKNLGCDVVRLPINLHAMTGGSPDYIVDPLLFTFLDQVVDWAEELHLYIILDNHSFDNDANTPINVGNELIPIWAQMANHYKNRSKYVCYEILNEPHGISDQVWGNIQGTVIDTIRAFDTFHSIIVGPANRNSYNNLDALPWYSDDNLIYTFHFYDPYVFTHQGADWTNPSLKSLTGVPFPYLWNKSVLPELPQELKGTWVELAYGIYDSDGTIMNMYELINKAADFKEARHAPVFCGEFGTYREKAIDAHRDMWYFLVRMLFDTYKISWTTWDYKGGFGLFEKDSFELYDYDLNVSLVKLLGFQAPEQFEYWLLPDLTGFDIYTDYVGQNIVDSSVLGSGKYNFYSDNAPAYGDYCLHFTDVPQYAKLSLRFVPTKDLSVLAASNYGVDLYVRSNTPGTKFVIRFMDTKTDSPYDHPWRKIYTIDNNVATWDGNWNHVYIPLNSFIEQGSFDNGQWYDPVGAFDWHAVDRFEIVAEYGDLNGNDLYFDNIRIVSPIP